jgi:hypothetical protein
MAVVLKTAAIGYTKTVIFWRVDRAHDRQNPATIRRIVALSEYNLITDRRFRREVGAVASRVVPSRHVRYTGGYTRWRRFRASQSAIVRANVT